MLAKEPMNRPSGFCAAFTLVELVAIIALLLLGISLLTPGLARTRAGDQSIQCLNNVRQLITVWQMYSEDNGGKIVINLQGSYAQGGNFPASTGPGWVEGWLDWTIAPDNTNNVFLVNPKYARFAPYVSRATNLFKCPADNYLSQAQRARGWTSRARSYSANIGIGAGNAEQGPWDPLYKHITKATDFANPGPSQTWVFVDEHADSVDDPGFFNPTQKSWVDVPATYHNGAASFAFADGHIETHKWVGSLAGARPKIVTAADGEYINNAISAPLGDTDIHWMSYHAGRVSTNSY